MVLLDSYIISLPLQRMGHFCMARGASVHLEATVPYLMNPRDLEKAAAGLA